LTSEYIILYLIYLLITRIEPPFLTNNSTQKTKKTQNLPNLQYFFIVLTKE